MPSRVLTVANQITLLRLIFVPVFAALVVSGRSRAALAVLIVAALSDAVDGAVARVFHQASAVGMALDPIADKILMTTAYLVLAFRGALPWWLTVVVITRDVGILTAAAVISLVAGYRPFPPTTLGKTSTAIQVVTVFVVLARQARIPFATPLLVSGFVYLAATLTAASGIHYVIVARHRFAEPAGQQPAPSGGGGK